MPLPRSPRRGRAAWAASAAVVTAAALLMGSAPPGATADDPARASAAASAQVDSAVLDTVESGKDATFFVVLKDQADLSGARRKGGHAAKAKAAFKELRAEATRSQRPLQSFLDKEKVGYESFWIANTLKVTGDEKLVEQLAKRSDVASIRKERRYTLEEPKTQAAVASAAEPEWGVKDIKADQVWSQYKDTGEGIVVANVDSGVQYDHPDLVANYRGNLGDGTFSHDYNFYDPTGQCTGGVPCDNNGHGTHTMGTIAGANGIGVAPGVKWIAAKGCEARECSDTSLLASGQWILAPTDGKGQNPRPELAPDIVNNSWGSSGASSFYEDIVKAWNAAGIFESFSAGNDGDGTTCSTGGSPAAQPDTYAVGAYDVNGKIANFSGFGPSPVDSGVKPNIAAPGVNVRSAWPGNAYKAISGTSMASPHVAGSAALLWSAAPSLIGKIDATRALLNDAARDVDDTHCGGTADFNNVWGEGKLDILGSVADAPRAGAAIVTGTVTDKATGKPVAGVSVAAAGPTTRTVLTAADGTYRLVLNAGTYTLTTSGYGWQSVAEKDVVLEAGQSAARPVALSAAATHAVSGTVLDVAGKPLKGASVRFTDAPLDAVTTDASGAFKFPSVAEGSYTLTATPTAPVLCNGVYSGKVSVDGDEAVRAALPARTDGATYQCTPATYGWIGGATKVALSGDENAKAVELPFPVDFYGVKYTKAYATSNGLLNFLEPRLGDYANTALPATAKPNGVIAAFWDDLTLDSRSTVKTAVTGSAGSRKFAVVWTDAAFASATGTRVSFEIVFEEASGAIVLQYQGIGSTALETGAKATVGVEDQAGTFGLGYSVNEAVIGDKTAVRFSRKG
ncbi:S8 family serine peptidase [Streptomyces sp. NBC_01304]|uniref:S8 family serine peptidase n=1 Tax=Streptomyces sp. NBC_01304 TaxID=2903818 RepID=UPI002E130FCB|nr:S8 family serine peptidase [Streptomyces sp. NBC_01304]